MKRAKLSASGGDAGAGVAGGCANAPVAAHTAATTSAHAVRAAVRNPFRRVRRQPVTGVTTCLVDETFEPGGTDPV